ncbi:mitogen-activated protein (MAP) kinase phosphatase [Plasmodium cynomolgi strain B]|uniref:Mitogen-activated protein (MAP) kinase phosphatase n=1 Tax=Plasmodium cynomolgi (strain B) TaxID=1120755 RepID=K6V5U3_PLACD|nr:mitogen-activated protein (MAP) kinase phosphatase [Plasmodium cynomolgi strain B]GAB64472.1 mitogen-activated protein (MAP) kinase phosphatase [Plasmodium cynomolgi strain B]
MGGEECPNKFEATILYRTYFVKDDLREDIFFPLLDAAHFIEEMLRSDEGNKILVHCNKGVCRSVIVVIFFLMTHLGLSFGDAFDLVKRRRPLSNPNLSFVSQLLRLFGLRTRLRSGGREGTARAGSTTEAAMEGSTTEAPRAGSTTEAALEGSTAEAALAGSTTEAARVDPPQRLPPPGEVTLIFRIDGAAGKALTLTNLMSLSADADACTNADSASTNPTEIDQRFNYVLTKDLRAFYLLLLDPTFEDLCTPLLERFARICRAFFHGGPADSTDSTDLTNSTDLTQTVVRADVGELMQRLRLDTQLFSRLPCNDGAYRRLQEALQGGEQ